MPFIKNIEQKMKLSLTVAIAALATSIIISSISFYYASHIIAQQAKNIYVLDRNYVPLLAHNETLKDNRPAEYKAAVEQFHYEFFTLPPDESYIKDNVTKALNLVDASGVKQYHTLEEEGYYTNLMSTNSFSTISVDSITLDLNSLKWVFYGTQKIERPSAITIRDLITTGYLEDVPRTPENPHGVLLTHWITLENKDISTVAKTK
jgi:conjugative transposon TraK protein